MADQEYLLQFLSGIFFNLVWTLFNTFVSWYRLLLLPFRAKNLSRHFFLCTCLDQLLHYI